MLKVKQDNLNGGKYGRFQVYLKHTVEIIILFNDNMENGLFFLSRRLTLYFFNYWSMKMSDRSRWESKRRSPNGHGHHNNHNHQRRSSSPERNYRGIIRIIQQINVFKYDCTLSIYYLL